MKVEKVNKNMTERKEYEKGERITKYVKSE